MEFLFLCYVSIVVFVVIVCRPKRVGFSPYAKYRVIYPDGSHSIPCYYSTAKDYASIFNGKVKKIPRSERQRP